MTSSFATRVKKKIMKKHRQVNDYYAFLCKVSMVARRGVALYKKTQQISVEWKEGLCLDTFTSVWEREQNIKPRLNVLKNTHTFTFRLFSH